MVTYEDVSRNVKIKNLATIHNLAIGVQDFTVTPSSNTDICGLITVTHDTTPVVLTALGAPNVGQLFILMNTSSGGTAAHTITLPSGVTWNGTNRIATTNAPGEYLVCVATSATRFLIILNNGVTFS